jgi:hypothetical protein
MRNTDILDQKTKIKKYSVKLHLQIALSMLFSSGLAWKVLLLLPLPLSLISNSINPLILIAIFLISTLINYGFIYRNWKQSAILAAKISCGSLFFMLANSISIDFNHTHNYTYDSFLAGIGDALGVSIALIYFDILYAAEKPSKTTIFSICAGCFSGAFIWELFSDLKLGGTDLNVMIASIGAVAAYLTTAVLIQQTCKITSNNKSLSVPLTA